MTLPITSRSVTTTTPVASTTPTPARTGIDRLGKQDFLQLLTAQLRNQDPLKPMEDKEFIAQLAQFSSLETLQNLDKSLTALAEAQQLGQAAGMIGKRVEAALPDGSRLTGTVTEVKMVSGKPRLLVDGKTVEVSQITSITAQAESASQTGLPTASAPSSQTAAPAGAAAVPSGSIPPTTSSTVPTAPSTSTTTPSTAPATTAASYPSPTAATRR
jgi:flagellar basal-body rod modification protein FlgD